MKRTQLFILILDALLRPSNFAAFLANGPWAIAQASLATLLMLGITFSTLVLGLGHIIVLGPRGVLAGLLLGPLVAFLFAAFYHVGGQHTLSLSAMFAFGFMRSLIAIALPSTLLMATVYSTTFADGRHNLVLNLLILVFFGVLCGGTLVIVLMQKPRRTSSSATRLVLTAGILVIGIAIWLSPPLRQTDVVLVAPVCVGLAVGLVRPFSYLWEAPLSLALAVAVRLGVPARCLLAIHPVCYDDLCVLPLPGLAGLLIRACATDIATGGTWLLRVAQHPGQARAARWAVEHIVRNGADAHRMLLWLSTQPIGVAFLQELAEQSSRPQPLVSAYAAFAQDIAPEAWPHVIDQQRSSLKSAADLPGGVVVLAFLEAGAAILQADRWNTAVAALRMALDRTGEQPVQLRAAMEALRLWVDADLATLIERRTSILNKAQDDLEGWPGTLFAAMSEHLSILARTEQYRVLESVGTTGEDRECVDRRMHIGETAPEGGQRSRASLIDRLLPISRSLSQPVQPTVADYDTLKIHISRSSNGEYFQVTLRQLGTNFLGGPFQSHTFTTTTDVEKIRSVYTEHIAMLHELRVAGIPVAPPDPQQLVALGQHIAELLPLMARQGIVGAVQRARRHQHRLRVLLEVTPDARELFSVPWELMVLPLTRGLHTDDGGKGFLLLNADVTLVRQVQGIGRSIIPKLTAPLTMQVFAATPVDGGPIDLVATRQILAHLLPDVAEDQYWYNDTDTLVALRNRFLTTNPQVLHLVCHGEQYDTGRGIRSDLLFTHRDGYTQRVSAFDLTPLLTLVPNLQLVVLQACYSGTTPLGKAAATSQPDEPERLAVESIGLTLVRHGIPAVIAMQGEVAQETIQAFVQAFYMTLAQEKSLDQAVAAGRIAMYSAGGLVDWSIPVMYQGSGQPEPETGYTRLADALSSHLGNPSTVRSLRGSMIVVALFLFLIGSARWLLEPARATPNLAALFMPLVLWLSVGLVGPAIIAVAHRGVRNQSDLSAIVRRAALRAQWMGAYLGYALGGLIGLTLFAALWMAGLLVLLPEVGVLLFGGVLLAALFFSYVTARSQIRTALAIAPYDPTPFSLPTVILMTLAMLFLMMVPFGVFWLAGSPFSFLLDPAPAAVGLSAILLLVVLGFND